MSIHNILIWICEVQKKEYDLLLDISACDLWEMELKVGLDVLFDNK
jgi:hypothetical protein